MCGIIGCVSNNNIVSDLISGLYALEYRGYDSAGIAINDTSQIISRKSIGGIKNLDNSLNEDKMSSTCGIGHTRWATHGEATISNCHPIHNEKVAVAHNGIIENYTEIKDELIGLGYKFQSDTDTEVITNLITYHLDNGLSLLEAVKESSQKMQGLYAFVALTKDHPNKIIGYKNGAPLIVGLGEESCYVSSDTSALANFSSQISYLEDGEICLLTNEKILIYNLQLKLIKKDFQNAKAFDTTNKGNHQHFMLKEIFEQPQILNYIFNKYTKNSGHNISFPEVDLDFSEIKSIKMVACGSSYYAASVAVYWMEELLSIPVSVDIASEFCYRSHKTSSDTLYIFISQSGETADTLASLKRIKNQNGKTLSITNSPESSIARLSQNHINIYAGVEVSVASTKACTAQLMVLSLLSLHIASSMETLSQDILKAKLISLQQTSELVNEVLLNSENLNDIASQLQNAERILYIGRGETYPIALEGALKLREITYLTSMGVAAGELKHGTIALIDPNTPTIVLAPFDNLFSKTASSARGIAARKGPIFALSCNQGYSQLADICTDCFIMPQASSFISPIVYSAAVQLIAYKVAVLAGVDIDKPRNLAKSVTVE